LLRASPLTVKSSLVPKGINIVSISQRHYAIGYALYIARQPITACQSADQKRGWMAALSADAECATPGYASKAGF
jgi:hypothetical protein